jgi:membrane-associated phospholipid phosphatase
MRSAIRATAWALVGAGACAPALRRRLGLRPAAVLGVAALAPPAAAVAMAPGRRRDVAVCALQMWAYIAAYELPHDDAEEQSRRVAVDYPIRVDRLLGLGELPTIRLQRRFSRPGEVNAVERVLSGCHWVWFAVPHLSLAYVLLRAPERFPGAAARMYSVFDVGAVFYWLVPTAPPWWAAEHGRLGDGRELAVRRTMIEYGPQFWGPLWAPLYGMLGGNPLAAMPSLHFATSAMGARLLWEVDPVAGTVGSAYAAALGLALVYLGEHYLIDVLAGAALSEAVQALSPRVAPLYRAVERALGAVRRFAAGPL